jgi:hypothetical protein
MFQNIYISIPVSEMDHVENGPSGGEKGLCFRTGKRMQYSGPALKLREYNA